MIAVTITEAQQRFPELIAAAAAGEPVKIRETDGRIFRLVPQPEQAVVNPKWPGYPAPGSCEGLFVVPDDFKEPLEELRE